MLIERIITAAEDLLRLESGLVSQLVAVRKRFENWMQIEIFRRLLKGIPNVEMELERPYPDTRDRCDLWCREIDGSESWVELKVCVTNYAPSYGIHIVPRPITNQIDDIIADGLKLKRLPDSFHRHVFFLAYPMAQDHDTHAKWCEHLSRIAATGIKPEKVLAQNIIHSDRSALVVGYRIAV